MAAPSRNTRRTAKQASVPRRATQTGPVAKRATAKRRNVASKGAVASPAKSTRKVKNPRAPEKKTARRIAKPNVRKSSAKRASTAKRHDLVLLPPSAAAPRWTEKLRNGLHVMIRPIRKTDAALERAFIEGLSPRSRRFRFLGVLKTPSDALIRQLTEIDYQHDMAFIALIHEDGKKKEVGVSRYSLSADGKSCECAVTVADDWQGRGLGSLLMRHLIEVARASGIRKMLSIDASENLHMRELATYLGFECRRDPEDSHQVIYHLDL